MIIIGMTSMAATQPATYRHTHCAVMLQTLYLLPIFKTAKSLTEQYLAWIAEASAVHRNRRHYQLASLRLPFHRLSVAATRLALPNEIVACKILY